MRTSVTKVRDFDATAVMWRVRVPKKKSSAGFRNVRSGRTCASSGVISALKRSSVSRLNKSSTITPPCSCNAATTLSIGSLAWIWTREAAMSEKLSHGRDDRQQTASLPDNRLMQARLLSP